MTEGSATAALRACSEWLQSTLSRDTHRRWTLARTPPFSFRCGGVSSSDLLPLWRARVTTETPSCFTAHFADPASGLRIEYSCTAYADFPAVDIACTLTNDGPADSPPISVLRPLDAAFVLSRHERVVLHTFRGGLSEAEAYAPYTAAIADDAEVTLGGKGGRSSGAFLPWLNVQAAGGGLLTLVGWSGQWVAEISRRGNLRVTSGLSDLDAVLRPGESIRAPRIVLLAWQGDEAIDGFNLGRRLFINHIAPRANGRVILPPIAKLTPYDEIDLDTWTSHHGEDNQLQAIEAAAGLGVEAYWLDAYWFDGYYPRGLGNWQFPIENVVRGSFPRGLLPLAEAAHRAGMLFILWFAPEVFSPGTYIDRHKSPWTLRLDGVEGGLFDLGNPEARAWMTRYIVDTLRAFAVDVCRMDLTREPLGFWRAADPPARAGITEIRYIEGLYAMWDEIRRALPSVWIDNCASGGQRIDLETCQRALPLWRSDFNDTPKRQRDEIGAVTDQSMIMALSHCVPFHAGPVWRSQPYYWRSALAAGVNIYWDLRPDRRTGAYAYDRQETRRAIEEVKMLRPFFQGDYYPLTGIDTRPDSWAAYEYVSDAGGFAMFFRRPESRATKLAVRLRGLEEDRAYRVEWRWNYERADERIVRGAELAAFEAQIADAPGSLLVRFAPV